MKYLALSCLAFCILATGCTSIHSTANFNSVKVDSARTPVETVEIENSGWYLFTFIPIASGDWQRPNSGYSSWFSNTVKLENNMKVLEREMKAKGVKEVANLTSHCTDEKYLLCLISRRAYHTSAVLLKPEEE